MKNRYSLFSVLLLWNGFSGGALAEKLFLNHGEARLLTQNGDVYGAGGNESLSLAESLIVTLDGNIENLTLPEALSSYAFSVQGTRVQVTGSDGSETQLRGLNQPMNLQFSDTSVSLTLNGFGDASLGDVSLTADPRSWDELSGSNTTLPSFAFEADPGIRLACAAVPRIGFDATSAQYYLYHARALNSGATATYALSSDGLTFGESQSVQTRIEADGSEKPPILNERTGFPEVVRLPEQVESAICGSIEHRIFHSNGKSEGNVGFGTGISSDCSKDGIWFQGEQTDWVLSPDGGEVGVTTAFVMNNRVHVFTMDGKSPNASQEYRHRVWHYRSTDAVGEQFELISDDPLNNGPTVEPRDRQNDPMSFEWATGKRVILTMKQHAGPINPPEVLTGEIYGWWLSDDNDTETVALAPYGGSASEPLITVEDFVAAGHDVYSVNDPSMYRMPDGSYRMYLGALVNIAQYPDNPELANCPASYPGKSATYAWVILSARSL